METFDIAVIGGGLIGASIAFELAASKLRVVVFDRQQPGQEASWAAAGMLSPAPDSPRDIPLVPLGRESLRLYPAYVAAIEAASEKRTGYAREGTLEIFLGPQGEVERNQRVATNQELGLATEPISVANARLMEESIGSAASSACWLPDEGTIEPRALTDAALAAARQRGVELRGGSEVTAILSEGGRCTGVALQDRKIAAGHVVVAAGCFSAGVLSSSNRVARYAPTRPVRGQMMALRAPGLGLRRVLRSEKGYLVPRSDGRVIAGSTSEEVGFDRRVTQEGLRRLMEAAVQLCPALDGTQVIETWAGLRPGTPDDLPIIGPTDIDGLLIATGHYRNGILLAPVTAKLIREWVIDRRTSFNAAAYSPMRFTAAALSQEK